MKYRIGCSDVGFSKTGRFEEALPVIRDAGFDCIDFCLYLYCLEPGQPMLRDNWKAWVGDTYRKIRESGLTVGQIHGLLNVFIPEDFHFIPPEEVAYRNLEACSMMECEKIVFHPVFYYGRVPTPEKRRQVLDYNIRWFGMLLEHAKANGVKIQLENTFDFANAWQPGDPAWPFTTAEDILEVVNTLGYPMEVCLDTGHANIAGQNIPEMIHAFGDKLKTLHLNDNFGNIRPLRPDLHLFPGYGNICWSQVFRTLKETGFQGLINLEPVGNIPLLQSELRQLQLKAAADSIRVVVASAGFEV